MVRQRLPEAFRFGCYGEMVEPVEQCVEICNGVYVDAKVSEEGSVSAYASLTSRPNEDDVLFDMIPF